MMCQVWPVMHIMLTRHTCCKIVFTSGWMVLSSLKRRDDGQVARDNTRWSIRFIFILLRMWIWWIDHGISSRILHADVSWIITYRSISRTSQFVFSCFKMEWPSPCRHHMRLFVGPFMVQTHIDDWWINSGPLSVTISDVAF